MSQSNPTPGPEDHGGVDFVSPGPPNRSNTFEGGTWESLNLLSLDGGGIRGYWSLRVLEKLMYHIGEEEMELAKTDPQGDADTKEGLHSFWPKQFPSSVTHVPKEFKKEGSDDFVDDERAAGFGSAGEIRKWQASRRYLPCHYFDYICGSSTGGLIAIMLSRFRMTVKDCLQEYENLGNRVFGSPRKVHKMRPIPGILPWNKFDADTLEEVFQDFTYRRAEIRDRHSGPVTFPTKPGVCKAFVTTLKSMPDKSLVGPFLIRSYRHPEERKPARNERKINYGEAQNFEIWQVARAATAAPTIFRPLRIDHQPVSVMAKLDEFSIFSDGGFALTNNPCQEGYNEIKALHAGTTGGAKIAVVVSIGTAKPAGRFGTSVKATAKRAVDVATSVDHVDTEMREKSNDGRAYQYFRFNTIGDNGCDVEMDEWEPRGRMAKLKKKAPGSRTLADIDENFRRWYTRDVRGDVSNKDYLIRCAKQLVSIRRARVLEKGRWERYATVSHYYCDRVNCEAEFQYRELFVKHLQMHDETDGSKINGKAPVLEGGDERIKKCRKRWEYPGPPVEGEGRY